MSGRAGRAAPMAPEERRRAIIEAVVPLLVSHGAVTTRQIAEAAGVAEGTIFRVFPDKCALMHAAAEATMNPESGRSDLEAIDPGLGLRATVEVLAEHLLARIEQMVAVMVAVRGMVGPTHDGTAEPAGRHRQPPFVAEANRALLTSLTTVFDRHRDELAVEPERAALLLRSLVFGSRHPGEDASVLTAAEIATVLVDGIASNRAAGERGR